MSVFCNFSTVCENSPFLKPKQKGQFEIRLRKGVIGGLSITLAAFEKPSPYTFEELLVAPALRMHDF